MVTGQKQNRFEKLISEIILLLLGLVCWL